MAGTEEYEVEILLEGDSVEDMLCDCPYAEDGNACKHMPAQWIEYRERYLSGRNYHKLELMESEGLWVRLMEAVTAAGRLSILDHYEAALKERYPNELLEAYARILAKESAVASNRKQYHEWAHYLKKLERYPGGTERVLQLAKDWHIRYSRRRAMMEELKEARF